MPEATLAQRLVRAKRKIRESGIRFTVPASPPPGRTAQSVRTVVYLVFNEGFAASGGDALIRDELCDEAIWLGRLLHRLMPEDAETAGLLALMLLHYSRAGRPARRGRAAGAAGRAGPLLAGTALSSPRAPRCSTRRWRGARPGPISCRRRSRRCTPPPCRSRTTDWAQIALLYGSLARLDPSPVIAVNRAVAVGMADGPLAGLAVLAPVLDSGALD